MTIDSDSEFYSAVQTACRPQNRYRSLIVIGKPHSGKSKLIQRFCQQNNWQYIDYTEEEGYLNSINDIEQFTPERFLQKINTTIDGFVSENRISHSQGLVIDEIEAILSTWRTETQNLFFSKICNQTSLPCGLIVTTRLRTHSNQLRQFIKNNNQVFSLTSD
jgi:hypothetical protein